MLVDAIIQEAQYETQNGEQVLIVDRALVPDLPAGWQQNQDFDHYRYQRSLNKFEIFFTPQQLSKIEVPSIDVKIALDQIDQLEAVNAAVAQHGTRALQMKWEGANTFNRFDPDIIAFAQMLNIDLDALWAAAKAT